MLYIFLFLGVFWSGANPLMKDYSILQVLFIPFVLGGGIAIYHYRSPGEKGILNKTIVGVGINLISALIFSIFLTAFLSGKPELYHEFIDSSVEFLKSNKEQFVAYSGEEEYEQTLIEVGNATKKDVILDDFLKKVGLGLPFVILFVLLFFSLPNYFGRPNN